MSHLLNAYCTHREPPPLDFPHRLVARRDRSDPELPPHLSGFIQWIAGRGDGQMTVTLYHVLRHIERVQHQLSVELEDADLDAFGHWALASNALLFFPDSTVRDPSGGVLVYPTGAPPDDHARVPFPLVAWERKARSEELLTARGIPLAPVPPVISDVEVQLRTGAEVRARAEALAAVARRGLGGPKEDVSGLKLSPIEAKFLDFDIPDEGEMFEAAWRTESRFLLEWALGAHAELPWPGDLAPPMVELTGETLRPAGDILDQLDLHFRLHWAMRQAAQDKQEPPPGVNLSVVMERHYTLNWLVRFEDAEWDDVDMPT